MKDDLISRQAAVDAVKKNTFRLTFAEEQNCEGHVAWSAYAVYSDVIEGALLELPSAQPEQRWIPCSKGLPKKDGDYYVTTHNGQIARYVFIKGVSEEYWMRCATAWMPLPEPYKEEP